MSQSALRIDDFNEAQTWAFVYGFRIPRYKDLEFHRLFKELSQLPHFIELFEEYNSPDFYIVRFGYDKELGFNATSIINDEVHKLIFSVRHPGK